MGSVIFVTGATGTVSTRVLEALATRKGVTVRAGVLPGAPRTPALALPGVTPVDFDFADAATFAPALDGVRSVFLLTPFTEDQVLLGTRFLDVARHGGVSHLVKLSARVGAGAVVGRWHQAIERHAAGTGVPLTVLESSFFFQNFINYYPPQADGAIYLPWGEGKAAFVDVRDVGEAAATVLTTDGHGGRTYELTGPEALGAAGVARAITSASGRAVRYVDVPEDAARTAMSGLGMPGWMVGAMAELHAVIKTGGDAAVTKDLAGLLGRPPRSVDDFARDHASAWRA